MMRLQETEDPDPLENDVFLLRTTTELPIVFPGWLILTNVHFTDAGLFTCRVEFSDSPTQSHEIDLTVYGK